MRSIYMGWLLALLVGVGILCPTTLQATHVRAGEITTRRLPSSGSGSALTYEITLTAYYDVQNGQTAAAAADQVLFCLGDGTQQNVPRLRPIRFLNNATTINIYRFVYTYAGGGVYTISARVINRNDNTRNINNGNSLNVNFFVSTTIFANASLGLNSNPVLLNAPVDSAKIGQRYCHNPAAFDPDGDSLSYRIATPQRAQGEDDVSPAACRSLPVPAYQLPNVIGAPGRTEAGGSPATFTVDPRTGDVCWDAPVEAGQYNYAFVIQEWRQGVLIGEITRDVQVIVLDGPNKRPLIDPIADICAEAGSLITQAIRATDPDGNRILLQGYGGPFNRTPEGTQYAPALLPPAYATLTPAASQPSPATGTFSWQTNCSQLRQDPYQITIKATDQPPRGTAFSLNSYETFGVRLIAPRPQNLTARPLAGVGTSGRAIQLNWSGYSCLPPTPPADQQPSQMIVYRQEGCDTRNPPSCTTGILSGYTRIGSVPLTATTFTDTTNLRRGVSYTYRIVAQFALPTGGESVVSAGVCLSLPLLAPVLTQVTVDSTGPATGAGRGVITVRWSRPIGLNPADGGGPFQYRLLRAEGATSTAFTQLTAVNTGLLPSVVDTVYVDRGVNTAGAVYRYRLEFYTTVNGQLLRQETTEIANSVRLSATGGIRLIELSWAAAVPWSNDNQTHLVYRSRTGPAGPFNLIAQVAVQGPATYRYVDSGADLVASDGNTSGALSLDSSYCYRVQTVGQYADPTIRARTGRLLNYSQIQCASPGDTTRPCAPALTVDQLNCASLAPDAFCNQTSFANTLSWSYPTQVGGQACDARIASYNLYYARYEGDSLRLLANIPAPTTTFVHQNLTTVAGCYEVRAVNNRGLESGPSNRVCKDICPLFALPNLFTPNGDGKNDVFTPLRCPRFVERVEVVIYNRWGVKVYESAGPVLGWNGQTTSGKDLPGGLYYYEVRVVYAGLQRNAAPQLQKGYVQLIRDAIGMR
ncbi:hypothetical protein FAES_2548 [Fibrella aestuarina BUZ 2]|uniref:Gliding motility-associated C-terminal domain-containing protein n=1 Tax=Fibrella aestuarina BUZ 2 TaxID=1166018 RepID=I0K8V4_9BACT|nr:T9SS C-terminal target domain-containing protein [Fibrella aestuarina]CCH00557.1 hypothetical protein FAES_2548 [Fibrella aestuarina BUZ 2]